MSWAAVIIGGAAVAGGALGSGMLGGGGSSGPTSEDQALSQDWMNKRAREDLMNWLTGTGQMDYINNLHNKSINALSNPVTPYTGDNGQGLTNDMTTALNMIKARALQGNAGLDTAKSILGATANGDYLNPDTNPYLSFFAQKALEQALPAYTSTGQAAGRYGSNAFYTGQNNLQSDIMNKIYGGAYTTERQNQLNAAQQLPQLYEMDYNDAAKLLDAGNTRRVIAKETYDAGQQAPWTTLMNYKNTMQGVYPAMIGTNYNAPTLTNQNTNSTAGAIGGGTAGLGLGRMFASSFLGGNSSTLQNPQSYNLTSTYGQTQDPWAVPSGFSFLGS